MALREKFMVKQVYGNTDLSLEADTGKSLLVKDIFVYNPASSYLTVKTEKTTVGYFRVGGNLGSHLPLPIGSLKHSHNLILGTEGSAETLKTYPITNAFGAAAGLNYNTVTGAAGTKSSIMQFGSVPLLAHQTILSLLAAKGLFKGFPIAEGQTMTFSGVAQAAALQVAIYEEYDAGDITEKMPNGSASDEYLFINYGRVSAAVTKTGDTIYDTVQTPAEFPDFPFGKDVPAKMQIELLAILASDVVDDRSGNDSMTTEYLKLIRERVTLFDDDKNGLLLKGITGVTDATAQFARGLSLIGNFSDVDGKPPLFFDPPLVFAPGEELGVYITTAAGASQSASDLAAADLEIGLIERVKAAA